MKRKLLTYLLTLAMALSLLPTVAFATEDTWPSKGEGAYILLKQDNANYKLSSNVTDLVVVTGKNVTIDLNGNNIAVEWDNADSDGVYMAVQVAGGSLTLKNSGNTAGTVSSTLKSGTNMKSQAAGVMVCNGGSFTLDNGEITANANSGRETFGVFVFSAKSGGAVNSFTMSGGTVNAEYGVRVLYEGASFTMTGGTVEGDVAVSGHGDAQGDTKIDISDGTITGYYQGIYQPQTGTLNISGGTITGWGGVEVKSGTVTIKDNAKIVSRVPDGVDPEKAVELFGDTSTGTSSAGYAVAVVEDNSYAGGADVTISGGTFEGKLALLKSGQEIVDHDAVLKINGGTFDAEQVQNYLKGDVCWSASKSEGGHTVATSHKYDPSSRDEDSYVAPTCTTDGSETLVCTVCGKEESDENGVVTRKISKLGHDFSIWVSDETQHWQKCSREDCNAITEKTAHENNTTCKICGYNCEHKNVASYARKDATCATEGYKPYSVCTDCGKHVVETSSGSGTYTVTSDSLVIIEKTPHRYTWYHDGSQHWQECSECGYTTAKLNHEYSGRTCTVCGYTKSSSSSSSSSTTYAVSVNTAKNGSVSVSPKNASKGTTVTVTTTPDKGWTLETLTVLDKDGKEVELTTVTVGEKYTFTMPSGTATVEATFMEDNTILNYFADVKASDFFYDAVLWAAENGITTGVDDLHFAPATSCTRAQIVTFLWRAAGSPEPKSVSSFTDVASNGYYAKAVAWAVESGITNGTGDGVFSPNEVCTRAQSVTFLARALDGKAAANAEFSDVPAGSWYAGAVAWAAANGVTEGIGGGLFGSDNNCTRGQIVTFLFRAYNK